jgi:hypothetical protein
MRGRKAAPVEGATRAVEWDITTLLGDTARIAFVPDNALYLVECFPLGGWAAWLLDAGWNDGVMPRGVTRWE